MNVVGFDTPFLSMDWIERGGICVDFSIILNCDSMGEEGDIMDGAERKRKSGMDGWKEGGVFL